jgi:hypothetical protein
VRLPAQTVQEILGKTLNGKAKIIDGRHQVAPGLIIHPAFRGHTYGSQLLQVNTPRGQLVFGSDTYSSWEGIRDWFVANIQQTDTVQQFLAYEKCYVLTSRLNSFNNCIAAHEPKSYTPEYPITANWWNIPDGHCSRAAELILANGESTHVPATRTGRCASIPSSPPHPITRSVGCSPGRNPARLTEFRPGCAIRLKPEGTSSAPLSRSPMCRSSRGPCSSALQHRAVALARRARHDPSAWGGSFGRATAGDLARDQLPAASSAGRSPSPSAPRSPTTSFWRPTAASGVAQRRARLAGRGADVLVGAMFAVAYDRTAQRALALGSLGDLSARRGAMASSSAPAGAAPARAMAAGSVPARVYLAGWKACIAAMTGARPGSRS